MENILGFIGIAKRAGKISAGSFMCETAVKSEASELVIIASDASSNTKKALMHTCNYYNVPFLEFSDMESLGRATGGGEKAVISVNDKGFAKALIEKINSFMRKDR